MPVHDAGPFLDQALESVRAQTWPRLELVAVDDGSTDGSGARLDELASRWTGPGRRATVIHQANAGAGAARDAGIAVADGEIVALFDADDHYDRTLVTRCMAALSTDSSADVAFAPARIVDSRNRPVTLPKVPAPRIALLDLLDGQFLNHPLIRRGALREVGGHDATLPAGIDLDLFIRLSLKRPGCVVTVPQHLSTYRQHEGQLTQDWRRVAEGWRHAREVVRRAHPEIPPSRLAAAEARSRLFWAELAYRAGDYAAVRSLMWGALRTLPTETLSKRQSWIRTASCVASLLPPPLHDRIRRGFNAGLARI